MDGATWGALIGSGAAAAAALTSGIALLYTRSQLRQARTELDDRRLDHRVKGILGENLLLISTLNDQARNTLENAKSSVDRIAESVLEVQKVTLEAKSEGERASEALKQLDAQLAAAREVVAQLNRSAERAAQDAEEIKQVKSNVQILTVIREAAATAGFETLGHGGASIALASSPYRRGEPGNIVVVVQYEYHDNETTDYLKINILDVQRQNPSLDRVIGVALSNEPGKLRKVEESPELYFVSLDRLEEFLSGLVHPPRQ